MIPPFSQSDESEHDRFRRFAKALLSVPKAEITPEETLAKLEAEKRRVDAKLAEVRQVLAQRRTTRRKRQ